MARIITAVAQAKEHKNQDIRPTGAPTKGKYVPLQQNNGGPGKIATPSSTPNIYVDLVMQDQTTNQDAGEPTNQRNSTVKSSSTMQERTPSQRQGIDLSLPQLHSPHIICTSTVLTGSTQGTNATRNSGIDLLLPIPLSPPLYTAAAAADPVVDGGKAESVQENSTNMQDGETNRGRVLPHAMHGNTTDLRSDSRAPATSAHKTQIVNSTPATIPADDIYEEEIQRMTSSQGLSTRGIHRTRFSTKSKSFTISTPTGRPSIKIHIPKSSK
ncbi:uncharacterized protein LOC129875206 isoform X2 [Solanum dulcamara]|uniref:uncharacterized protein LOC129875206 isoform X2 n=1 Tax=Solanum dulcamara TaxID=45834 RepID=UPI0024856EC6|nr:uncharacterized protein LOC129875206 isoform X2 [Solanum dulcamara]